MRSGGDTTPCLDTPKSLIFLESFLCYPLALDDEQSIIVAMPMPKAGYRIGARLLTNRARHLGAFAAPKDLTSVPLAESLTSKRVPRT